MCTRAEGVRIYETYNKYWNEREVDIDDLRFLEILSDSYRAKITVRDGKLYARTF